MFGKSAESVNQYLERGRQVSIIGELRQNRWEQDGQSRSKVEVVVNSLQLLSSPSGQRADAQAYGQSAPRQQQELPPIEYGGPEQFDDDQIPF
jgi:single-strand DNA-binding protein